MLTDVTVELGHETLAEAHDFAVSFPLGVEIRAAFAATDRQAGQGVFEDLLKTKEFDDPEIADG